MIHLAAHKIVTRLLAFGVLQAAAISMPATFLQFPAQAEAKRIGYILPLTGEAASFGKEAQRGLLIAKDKLQKNGIAVELIFEDEKCLPKDAANAWQKLTEVDKVDFVVGPGCSGSIMAAVPRAAAQGRPLLALWDAGQDVAQSGQHVFSLGFDSEKEGDLVAAQFLKKKMLRASLLWEEDKFAQQVKNSFQKAYEAGGGQIVAAASVSPGEQELASVVTRLISPKPDVIFISPAYSAVAAVKSLKKLGFKGPIFGQDTFGIPGVITAAPDAMEGVVFADVQIPSAAANVQQFTQDYITRFNEPPTSLTFAAFGYDSLMIASQVPAQITEQAKGLAAATWQGLVPNSSFKVSRMIRLPPSLFEIKAGKIVPYQRE